MPWMQQSMLCLLEKTQHRTGKVGRGVGQALCRPNGTEYTGLINEMPKLISGKSLSRDSGTPSSGGIDIIDFSFRGKTPTTMKDVTNILFSDEVIKMVRDGNLAAAFGLLFKWSYLLPDDGGMHLDLG